MLRIPRADWRVGAVRHDADPQDEPTVNVSLGTAGTLGLLDVRQTDPPTTAYLMIGGQCTRDCAFCSQARSSHARTDALSRIIWPPLDADRTLAQIASAHAAGAIHRCCLQVTSAPTHLDRAVWMLRRIRERCPSLPISTSIVVHTLDQIRRLFDAGADRIGIALDAATAPTYRAVKGPGWDRVLSLLETAAAEYPGRISSHLIAGLGESEAQMVGAMQRLADQGITVGLFAFTPVPGTALEKASPPSLDSYRRLQVARHLITLGVARAEGFEYGEQGHITSYGLGKTQLFAMLSDGRAFQTSGCLECNRPYYNERPGGAIYNYPRPLSRTEVLEAIALVLEVGS